MKRFVLFALWEIPAILFWLGAWINARRNDDLTNTWLLIAVGIAYTIGWLTFGFLHDWEGNDL